MASQNFEVGRPTPMAVELARIVDRGIRECRALDTEALAIVAGEKVWSINVNIHVIDHGGNLIDCVSLAAISAMMHYRRPEVSIQNNSPTVYNVDEHAATPLSLHHIPISISFCFIHQKHLSNSSSKSKPNEEDFNCEDEDLLIMMDPTDREEKIIDGTITFTFNSFRELCAVHKIGGAPISSNQVLRCANIAAARVGELTEILKQEAEKADQFAVEKRRAMLRGRDFMDVSSLSSSDFSAQQLQQERSQVDLGEMTDFATLHAPIPLREDPSQKEQDAKLSSMAQLLESLENAAGLAEEKEPSVKKIGLDWSNKAREEFAALTKSLQDVKDPSSLLSSPTSKKKSILSSPTQSIVQQNASPATKKQSKKTKKQTNVDDSDEETVVLQASEFSTSISNLQQFKNAPKPSRTTGTERKKMTTKGERNNRKKQDSSSDSCDTEEDDLSAAIKKKK
jgi:exosome complex RNA-binding protein Rrp42 (RNase PH superfamily)